MLNDIKRDTVFILQLFVLIIIGFLIKDKFFNKNKEKFTTNNKIYLYTQNDYNENENTSSYTFEITPTKITELEYTIDDLIKLKDETDKDNIIYYQDKSIKSIKFPSNYVAILYESTNMHLDKNKKQLVLKQNSPQFNIEFSSLKFIQKEKVEEMLEKEASENNQIYLFSEDNYFGEITKLNIPNKPHLNPISFDNKNINKFKSIIIPGGKDSKDSINYRNIFLTLKKSDDTNIEQLIENTNIFNSKQDRAFTYQITARVPNLDIVDALKTLNQNKLELDKLKNELNLVIQNRIDSRNDILRYNDDIKNNMIKRLLKNIFKSQNKLNYNIHHIKT